MKLADQIETMRAAQGDPLRLATVDVDLAYGDWPDERRSALREALVLASIAHWFDADVLAALADPDSPALALQRELEQLHCIERFVGRGPTACNVHLTARRAIRKALADAQPSRFATLSARAAAHFERDDSLVSRVEYLYHLVVADPERGAAACSALYDRWGIETPPEHQRALALAMQELLECDMLQGRARALAQLLVLTEQLARGESAGLRERAAGVRAQLEASGDPVDIALAADVQGQVALEQGEPAQAREYFGEVLSRLTALANESPGHPRWLHLLAVAHTRLADVDEWTAPESAIAHFDAAVEALDRLAARDASAAVRRECAVARARRGAVLTRFPERLDDAEADQRQALDTLLAMAAAEPANANRKSDVVQQWSHIGNLEAARSRFEQALEAHRKSEGMARELVALDPSRLSARSELAGVLFAVSADLESLERFDAAEIVLREIVALCRQSTDVQTGGVRWQYSLRQALNRLALLARRQGRYEAGLAHAEEYRAEAEAALSSRPGDSEARRDKAIAFNVRGQIRESQGETERAKADFTEALRLMELLLAENPDNAIWRQDTENFRSWVNAAT